MSIDIEDWFQVENLKAVVARETWKTQRLRVERNTERMLELMADAPGEVRGTCFVLGWVAQKCPDLVRRIAAAGHEVACHGYGHDLLSTLTPQAFRADVERSKSILEDITGTPVRGYRAPSFSITKWAIPILQDLGFSYDSSLFPSFSHDRYGALPGIRADQPVVELSDGFYEIGVSCITIASRGVPWGGGGYFRLLPYSVFRGGARQILRSGRPYVFYIHPWEIDPSQPRVRGLPRLYRFRHYVGLARCETRFASLVADFQWTTMAELLVRWTSASHNGNGGHSGNGSHKGNGAENGNGAQNGNGGHNGNGRS
jgi:polysaccharide deacetylase family protein (PEP-CTERM system associated)